MISIRSCDSLRSVSYGVIPVSRLGTLARSISTPVPPRLAVSQVEQVRPAAPISWIPATASVASSSRQASNSNFSLNGSPTWTAGQSIPAGLRADVKNRIAYTAGCAAGKLLVSQDAEAKHIYERIPFEAFIK